MTDIAAPQTAPETAAGLPRPTSAPGVHLYPESFERIIALLGTGIDRLAADAAYTRLHIPPVIARATIEHAGYVNTFPQLLGTVHSFAGTPREWARLAPLADGSGDWHVQQQISDLVLLPAACYPVYDTLTGQDLLAAPARFHVDATCFRQEASAEPGRLRSFRMTELVTAGSPEHCQAWRAGWVDRIPRWLTALGLDNSVEVADDPFFGPGRTLYAAAQRLQELKLEFTAPVAPGVVQAIASANLHKDHFGEAYGFRAGDEVGHTSCMAFGLERIALALINAHGADPDGWPAPVLSTLE
jgi:seryl-tRNA synthetase